MDSPTPDDWQDAAALWAWAGWQAADGHAVTPMAAVEDLVDQLGRQLHALGMAGADTWETERRYDLALAVLGVNR